jgi:hypothetical protein
VRVEPPAACWPPMKWAICWVIGSAKNEVRRSLEK